ncbi:MAG TPA: hypothetical protein VJ932_05415, partial [Alkalispirochaeta sp.]|nr:hypothetical protein [Alkalispirochaeta sp.]
MRLLVLSTTPQVRLKLLAHFPPSHLSDNASSLRSIGQVVNSLGLQPGDGAEEVVRALLNSHRELSPALIRALAVRIDRDLPERGRQRRARLLVELADKGMDPDREELRSEELLPYLTDGRWGQRGSEHQHRLPQGTSRREPLTSLRAFLQRTTATPSHSVQLFNHLSGNGDLHWVVIPIGAHRDAHATTGTLRVGLDTTDNTAREATLALGVGAGVWWFSWVIDQGTARMV